MAAVSKAVKKHQMMRVPSRVVWTMKARGPTVRQRGQTPEAAMGPPNNLIIQRAHLKHPHQ